MEGIKQESHNAPAGYVLLPEPVMATLVIQGLDCMTLSTMRDMGITNPRDGEQVPVTGVSEDERRVLLGTQPNNPRIIPSLSRRVVRLPSAGS